MGGPQSHASPETSESLGYLRTGVTLFWFLVTQRLKRVHRENDPR